ncbi:MAG: putative quinol monooxygenase [Rubrivivax sp.]
MIALIVTLDVHSERLHQFLAAIEDNAARSFNDEPGCRYFDVTQDTKQPTRFVFYELYDDEAAIDAHRKAPHFARWREAAEVCVVPGSQVNTFCRQLFHHA